MKPTVLISKCLGFDNCRYNGDIINFELVDLMKDYINFIPVCPEVEIGLSIPRESLRLIKKNGDIHLVQPYHNIYFTEKMKSYAKDLLKDIEDIDGFILKGRSPSCGIKDVKIYSGIEKSPVIEKGKGIFAKEVFNSFSYLPIEEEGRLMNLQVREHFFTQLFTIYNYKNTIKYNSMKELIGFHAKNKYLYFAYDQGKKNKLGTIVANHEMKSFDEVSSDYFDEMVNLFSKLPTKKNYINAFHHIFGYFSQDITRAERTYILKLIEKYNNNKIDRSSIVSVLNGYAIKYNLEYLLGQTIFEQFPEELTSLKDSGKLDIISNCDAI